MTEYRTPEDVFKEIAKAYSKLGELIYELQRMFKPKK